MITVSLVRIDEEGNVSHKQALNWLKAVLTKFRRELPELPITWCDRGEVPLWGWTEPGVPAERPGRLIHHLKLQTYAPINEKVVLVGKSTGMFMYGAAHKDRPAPADQAVCCVCLKEGEPSRAKAIIIHELLHLLGADHDSEIGQNVMHPSINAWYKVRWQHLHITNKTKREVLEATK